MTAPAPERLAISLTARLAGIEAAASQPPGLTMGGLAERLGEQGVSLVAVVGCLPFLLPVSIPGTSTPFGLLIALLGLALLRRRPIWIPRPVRDRPLPPATARRLAGIAARVLRPLERWLHPRGRWWASHPGARRLHGAVLIACGLGLAVPFPPFLVGSNAVFAWPSFILGLGLLEDDGVFVTAGYAALAIPLLYFAVLAWLGMEGVRQLWG